MTRKNRNQSRIGMALTAWSAAALLCFAGAAQAGIAIFNVGSNSGNPGDTVNIPLDFVADGSTANFDIEVFFNDNELTVNTSMCNGVMLGTGVINCMEGSPGTIMIQVASNFTPLPSGSAGVLEFTISPVANPGTIYTLGIGTAQFEDPSMLPTTGMANPGQIAVISGAPMFGSSPPVGGTLDFGTVTVGTDMIRSVLITNNGTVGDLILSNPGLSQNGDALSIASSFPIMIPAGQSDTVDVECNGIEAGPNSGTLTFNTNDTMVSSANYAVQCEVIDQTGGFVLIKFNGDDQTGNIGDELPVALQVQLFFANDPVSGAPLNWNVVSGDATFVQSGTSSLNTVSGTSGRSSANLQLGQTPGDIVIEVGNPNSTMVTFNATAIDPTGGGSGGNPEPVSGDGQSGMSGDTTDPLVVVVTDDDGEPVSGAVVDWMVTSGDGTLGMPSSTSDGSGLASNTVTFGPNSGDVVVTATVQNGGTTTFTLTNTGAGTALVLTLTPSSDSAPITGTSGPFRACLSDIDGHAIANAQLNWQIVIGDASVPGQTTTGGAGCSNNTVSLGNTPGAISLRVSANGAPDANAAITAFAPVVSPVSGDGQEGAPGDTLMPFVIQIGQGGAQKALGNVSVSWSILEGDGSLASSSTSTNNNGRSSNTYTLGSSTGTSRIRAMVPGMGSFDFMVVAKSGVGDDASITAVAGNGQVLATNVLSAPMVVELLDATGSPIPGAQINWSISPSDQFSTVTETVTFTGSDGRSSNTAQVIIPDSYIVTAAVEGTNLSAQFNLSASVSNTQGLTDIQASVGAAIDIACPTLAGMDGLNAGESDLLGRCTELVVNSGIAAGDVGNALDAMATEEATAQGNRAVRSAEAQLTNLKGRLLAMRSGAKVQALGGLTFTTPDGSIPASALAALLAEDNSGSADPGFSRLGFFVTGTIVSGDRDDTANEVGFDFDTYGLTAGMDYRFTDQFIMGAAIGYNNTDSDLSDGLSSLEADGYSLSAYGTYFTESGFYFDGIVTFGDNDLDSRRAINYDIMNASGTGMTSVNQVALGSPGSDVNSASFSVGQDFQHESMTISPYLRYSWTDIDIDAYSEIAQDPMAAGSGLALAIDKQTIESSIGTIGGQMTWAMSQDWGVLLPTVTLEYEHEFEDDPRTISARFVNDPTGTPFFVITDEPDRNYFNVGFGLSAIMTGGKTAYIFYEGVYGLSEISQHSLSAGMRFEF